MVWLVFAIYFRFARHPPAAACPWRGINFRGNPKGTLYRADVLSAFAS
ncbi:MAG: hypothetical protein QOF94_3001 [Acidobacteriaceae bacterium]|jgi:hypothetical protein